MNPDQDQNKTHEPGNDSLSSLPQPVSPEPAPLYSAPADVPTPQPAILSQYDVGVSPAVPSHSGIHTTNPSQQFSPMNTLTPVKKGMKKPMLIGVFGGLGLMALAGAVFGLYLPSKPQNVYKTGLSRSQKALTAIVTTATTKAKLQELTRSDITMKFDIHNTTDTYLGTLNTHFDKTKSDTDFSIALNSKPTGKATLGLKAMSEVPAGKLFPDIFFQYSGFKSLPASLGIPAELLKYDGQWIKVDSDYLSSIFPAVTQPTTSAKLTGQEFTAADASEMASVVMKVMGDYVFSSDPAKAVMEMRSFVGKEKTGDATSYHYKVGVNVAHAHDFCKAMVGEVFATQAIKHVPNIDTANLDKTKQRALKTCDDASKDPTIKDYQFDMWVDSGYKLISKLRFSDSKTPDAYQEVGQNYKGGDDAEMFVATHDGQGSTNTKTTLKINMKTAVTSLQFDATIGKADAAYVAKIEVSSKPSTGDITLQKPTTSIPIKDVLKQLGLDTSAINSGLTSLATSSTSGDTQLNSSQSDFTVGQAKDTGRMIHIRELHGAVEAYYADVGHYPTLANLNDSTWLATNMKTLDKSYRLDPDFFGLTDPLVAKPTAGRYSYGPTKKDGVTPCIVATDCVSYKLVAILSDGTRFTKTSLN